jgi:AcrR family transcriptional regulator
MAFMSSPQDDTQPEPPWSSLRGRGARRPPITRAAITAAALRVVDAEGLDGLSMRRIAAELGCRASALYVHVSGKQELLHLLIDHVAGELDLPEPAPDRWQEQVKELARAMHEGLLRHRDLAAAALGDIPTGPNALAVFDRLMAILHAGGLPRQVIGYAADLLPQFVVSSAYEGSIFARRIEADPHYFEQLDDYLRSLPRDRYPVLAELVDELTAPDEGPDARFEFGLGIIVAGLAASAPPGRGRGLPGSPKP